MVSSVSSTNRAPKATSSRAFAAAALHRRLESTIEVPPWVSYVSPQLRLALGWAGGEEDDEPRWKVATGADRVEIFSSTAPASPLNEVRGRIWSLSRDADGCRQVQRILEDTKNGDDEAREALLMELCGHVWEALRCPHANYVVQKFIVTTRPQALQFIVDELMSRPGAIIWAAQHRYGCRIIQRLVEFCQQDQTSCLVELVLPEAMRIAHHQFGNYVLQQILEHGSSSHVRVLMKVIEENASELGADPYSCAVLSKALTLGATEDRCAVARALLKAPATEIML
eukprot:TRINITY_DN19538_c0_g1_i1.p1 TRINITY_DN19538_c0_g1~~TRINITY_DN19538_c0_g1_i1.p1  ORF type:complete len:309 (-),score=51.39 TRINITY_DN19538_c0_g1_i1:231-1082(-)